MSSTRSVRGARVAGPASAAERDRRPGAVDLAGRLGLDQPAGWWPTTPRLKSFEAAGFRHLQVRMPPRALLADGDLVLAHATALRANLRLTGLRLILHAPDDLLAGTREHDRQFEGALTYAGVTGCELVVYHGAHVEVDDPRRDERLRAEERSLRRLLPRAAELGVRIAVENLAPVYPGPAHVCHDPGAVAALVARLDSDFAGMCLDIGHANIVAGLEGLGLVELIEPVFRLARVILFHVHDNFGAGAQAQRAGGIEPLRLDLHLPPGAGTVPWGALGPLVASHPAPLQLEIHPAQRPEPATLAILTREVFRERR
jgi:sugar phosphate isomerase/epimerase